MIWITGFFKGNQGLKSRFGYFLEIDEYNEDHLSEIFKKKVEEYGWYICSNIEILDIFKINKKYFKYFGRDIENLFSKCKIAHSKHLLKDKTMIKRKLIKKDIEEGLRLYKENININQKEKNDYESMYI